MKRGFKAHAMTEHGNINGIFQFNSELSKHGIKPILGVEFYIVENRFVRGLTEEQKEAAVLEGKKKGVTSRQAVKDKEKELGIRQRYHVVCLAKNNLGWRKIIRAVELSHGEGFYYFPRIDFNILEKLAPDVIVMTACLGGVPSQLIASDRRYNAAVWSSHFTDVFGDDFYVEIQPNDIALQVDINIELVRLAKEVDCNIVATNDVHYLRSGDHETHDVLLAVRESQGGKPVLVSDTNRFRYATNQLYLKSREEMEKSFTLFHPAIGNDVVADSLDATMEIVDKIGDNVLEFRKGVLPKLKIESEYDRNPDKKLVSLVEDGWKWRKVEEKSEGKTGYIDWIPKPEKKILVEVCRARVDHELGEILRLGFARYFLVIYDLVWWARRNGIRVGPGRGSVGGSYVAYLLGITAVDSIRHGCPFERFISPDRIDYPDIDLDFPSTEHERVKGYLVEKYGADKVAGIVNYDRMKGKQILKDIGRVYGVSWRETEKVTSYVPQREEGDENVYDCVKDMFDSNSEVFWYKDSYPNVVKHASQLEGNVRHLGVHAAGVVVADRSLRSMVPVQYQRKNGEKKEYLVGWDKKEVEKCGLLKLDILAVKSLDYIQGCIDLIKQRTGEEIEPEDIEDYNDTGVWDSFQKGFTELVWQMNSFGTISVLKRLKPTKLAHLVATNALIRPGPQNSGITDKYINRKNGLESKSIHVKLDEILEQTYGLFVFQEDVIRIVHSIGGFTLAEADQIRKDIGKKKGVDYLKKTYLDRFVASVGEHGINRVTAVKIWNMIAEFGKYGFNKAHSTGYSILSYWTMYLKIHYPLEYMCAALATETDNDKRRRYISEARRLGISIMGPDVNISGMNFAIDDNIKKTVRSGLVDVKGLGEKTVVKIISNAPYKDFTDFLLRSGANKTAISALLKIGALDSIIENPKQIDESLEDFCKARQGAESTRGKRLAAVVLKDTDPTYRYEEREKYKLELLSLPSEVHPSIEAINWLSANVSHITFNRMSEFERLYQGHFSSENFAFVGVASKVKYYQDDSNGEKNISESRLARIILEDDSGRLDVKIPAKILGKTVEGKLREGAVVLVVGSAIGFYKITANSFAVFGDIVAGVCKDSFSDYVLDDPFDEYVDFIDGRDTLKPLSHMKRIFKTCAYILNKAVFKTKTGKNMMRLLIVDWLGNFREVLVWPSDFSGNVNKIIEGEMYVMRLQTKKDGPKLTYFVDGGGGVSPVVSFEKYYERNNEN